MGTSKPDGQKNRTKRQYYSPELKIKVVRELERGQMTCAQLALVLGVTRYNLYRWRRELAIDTPRIPPPDHRKMHVTARGEVQRLKRALAQAIEERDILKKAAMYFVLELSQGTPLYELSNRRVR